MTETRCSLALPPFIRGLSPPLTKGEGPTFARPPTARPTEGNESRRVQSAYYRRSLHPLARHVQEAGEGDGLNAAHRFLIDFARVAD
jgi:hypothetical protein